MKKFGIGAIVLLLLSTLYYFANGATLITQKAKEQLNHELITLQHNGFSIHARKSTPKKEHFTLSFDRPKKIMPYLNARGAAITLEDTQALQGLQLGIDIDYFPTPYSALSVELYPVDLPHETKKVLTHERPKTMVEVERMLAQKTLLLHIDFNTILSGFKGYFKDINETLQIEQGEHLYCKTKKITFEGSIKEEQIDTLSQKIALFSLHIDTLLQVDITNLSGSYVLTGERPYNATSHYSTESIAIKAAPLFSLLLKGVENNVENHLDHGMASSSILTKAHYVEVVQQQRRDALKEATLALHVDALDIATLATLQQTDLKDDIRVNQLIRKLFSKGLSVTLGTLSAEDVLFDNREMDGFEMNSSFQIDTSFTPVATSQNLLSTLSALKMKTHIRVSNELYALIVQDPRAMIMMMMAPPKNAQNRKIYEIEFKQGTLTINGVSF